MKHLLPPVPASRMRKGRKLPAGDPGCPDLRFRLLSFSGVTLILILPHVSGMTGRQSCSEGAFSSLHQMFFQSFLFCYSYLAI